MNAKTNRHRCERCSRFLNPDDTIWLTLNSHTLIWYEDESAIPPEQNQGGFPFGRKCAEAVIKNGGELVRIKPHPNA